MQIALGAVSLLHCSGIRVVENQTIILDQKALIFEIEKRNDGTGIGSGENLPNSLRLASTDLAMGYQWVRILENAVQQAVQVTFV